MKKKSTKGAKKSADRVLDLLSALADTIDRENKRAPVSDEEILIAITGLLGREIVERHPIRVRVEVHHSLERLFAALDAAEWRPT